MASVIPPHFLGIIILVFHVLSIGEGREFVVWITDNGPIVQGSTITFTAELLHSDGSHPTGSFRYYWEDNTLNRHKFMQETTEPKSSWNVTYSADKYFPGEYEVQVNVQMYEVLFWFDICSRRTTFNITSLLNGRMALIQDSFEQANFVSNTTEVEHKIDLSEADRIFIKNATEIMTYWFVDCTLYGVSEDLMFNYTYGTVGVDHNVEALVVVSFDPIITTTSPAPTTPTPILSSTTSPTSPTSSTVSSTGALPATPAGINSSIHSNELGHIVTQGKMLSNFSHVDAPYICLNSSIIPPDKKKTYGYFHRKMNVKSPVQNISVKGTNWLRQGNLLDIQVFCTGSGNFSVCDYKEVANYNKTGNETCFRPMILNKCQFNVSRWFSYENYTVIVIIENDISKVVYPISVTLYEVQKHAQLSVIVVPVVCSLVAVILVVFGVAYYVQRRKRFTVEVADFDFGQIYDQDMEYKTFGERLLESVANSFNRDIDGEGNVWSPSRKYGSMQ